MYVRHIFKLKTGCEKLGGRKGGGLIHFRGKTNLHFELGGRGGFKQGHTHTSHKYIFLLNFLNVQ